MEKSTHNTLPAEADSKYFISSKCFSQHFAFYIKLHKETFLVPELKVNSKYSWLVTVCDNKNINCRTDLTLP